MKRVWHRRLFFDCIDTGRITLKLKLNQTRETTKICNEWEIMVSFASNKNKSYKFRIKMNASEWNERAENGNYNHRKKWHRYMLLVRQNTRIWCIVSHSEHNGFFPFLPSSCRFNNLLLEIFKCVSSFISSRLSTSDCSSISAAPTTMTTGSAASRAPNIIVIGSSFFYYWFEFALLRCGAKNKNLRACVPQ